MAQYNERIEELFDELDSVEYSPVQGVLGVMGRLDRIFWKLEQERFPVLNDHRIGTLMRALPRRARVVAQEIWDMYGCRLAYPELCRLLLRHEFPEDLGESGSESEDDEEDPEPEEVFEEDPEPEEVFEDQMEIEQELEEEDPDEDLEETVEDPEEIPENPSPIVPVPPRDDLVVSLLWFIIIMMYALVGRVAPPS